MRWYVVYGIKYVPICVCVCVRIVHDVILAPEFSVGVVAGGFCVNSVALSLSILLFLFRSLCVCVGI